MSKISELRRKAAEASREKRWEGAVKLYERICGLDGSNAGYRNELGDIFAKMGDIPQAIENFEKAVELYSAVGLSNNAIAVLKKILRYNLKHMDSHWGLGETRRRQGLGAEATGHFLSFIECADDVLEDNRDVFLDRCSMLLDNMPADLEILNSLDQLYEAWDMPTERARILVCKAKLADESGETDIVSRYLERAQQLVGDLASIPEYQELASGRGDSGPVEPGVVDLTDVDDTEPTLDANGSSLDLGFDLDFDVPGVEHEIPEVEEHSGADAIYEIDPNDSAAAPVVDDVTEDSAAHEILESSEEVDAAPNLDAEPEEYVAPADALPEGISAEPAPAASDASESVAPASPVEQGINLLEEILADESLDRHPSDRSEVDTIAHDMEGQLGADVAADDHKGQYEMGLVYMDMGMYEGAVAAFAKASQGEDVRLKALEMKGTCHSRQGQLDEALAAYQAGLAVTGYPARFYMGLLYEVGSCLEQMSRIEEALEYFERAAALDAGFLDVHERLERIQQTRS